MPSSRSAVFQAGIKSLEQLTGEKALKTTLQATLEFCVKYPRLSFSFLMKMCQLTRMITSSQLKSNTNQGILSEFVAQTALKKWIRFFVD